jgi:hypothetical protein
MNLEDRSDTELEKLKQQFSDLSGVALEVSEAAKKVQES